MNSKPDQADLLILYIVNLEILLLFFEYIFYISSCAINIYSHRDRKMFPGLSRIAEIMFHNMAADEYVFFLTPNCKTNAISLL